MPQPPRQTEDEIQSAVLRDSSLERALATQRDLAKVMPEYLRILDKIEAFADVGSHFDEALAGVGADRVDETARQLLHAVVVEALASTRATGLPQQHAAIAAKYQDLFAALRTLGAHFGVSEFPQVEIPADVPSLDDVDIDAELHRAIEVYRVVDELAAPTFKDPRSQALLVHLRYASEEAPALLLAIWKHLAIEMYGTLSSLVEPGLGRKRIKDADRLAFIIRLDAAMRRLLGRGSIGMITAMTNVVFDAAAEGGTSEDAVRKFLKRASVRKG